MNESPFQLYVNYHISLLPPATKLGQGNIFTPVYHSVHRGGMCGCCWGGVRGCCWGGVWLLWGGHVWLLWGGMHGCSQGRCVWLLWGGVCGCSWGACVVAPGGMRGIRWDTQILSMSRRYASCWNAFLLLSWNGYD